MPTLAVRTPRFATFPYTGALRAKHVLITGCNTGLGRALARRALECGAHLHFTCRDEAKVAATAAELRRAFPEARVAGYVLDLSSLTSVRSFCDVLSSEPDAVDHLILNAGVHVPFRELATEDGLELHHQVNFLAPALIFLSLAERPGAPLAQVAYVSSDAHRLGALPAVPPLSFWARYARSKLRATTFFGAVRPLFPDTTVSIVSPGNVATDVHRHKHPLVHATRQLVGGAQDPAAAAHDLLVAAFGSDAPEEYWNRGRRMPVSPRCASATLKLDVWDEVVSRLPASAPRRLGSTRHVLTNHSGTISHLAPGVRAPADESELAEIVRGVRAEGGTLRVVASRHSYNDCFHSTSTLVSLERFDRIGRPDERDRTVTVGAGVTVQDFCEHIDALGYTLPWGGNSGRQTLVGAALTGTHGYARDGGLLAELIVGLRAVDGRGRVVTVTDEDDLKAFRVSLGTLGVVTEVTLALKRKGDFVEYALDTLDEEEFLRRLPEAVRRNEHFRFFPNRFKPGRFSTLSINRTSEVPTSEEQARIRFIDKGAAPRWLVSALRSMLGSRTLHRVLGMLPAPKLRMRLTAPFSTLLFVNAGIVNRWYRLAGLAYQAWNDDRTRNMELAVRPEDFALFLREYRAAVEATRARVGAFDAYFTGRYAGASERAWLAPNFERGVIFIDVHTALGPHATDFLNELERRVSDLIPVRPHWGKEFRAEHAELRGRYPESCWRAFERTKARHDPDDVFSNAYTRRVFGW